MLREGIYIGGKEMVRRYVGNKLVWQKKNRNHIGKLTLNFKAKDTSQAIATLNTLYSYDAYEDLEKYTKATVVKRFDKFFKVNAVQMSSGYSSSSRDYGYLSIFFKNQSDRDYFLKLGIETSFYK